MDDIFIEVRTLIFILLIMFFAPIFLFGGLHVADDVFQFTSEKLEKSCSK